MTLQDEKENFQTHFIWRHFFSKSNACITIKNNKKELFLGSLRLWVIEGKWKLKKILIKMPMCYQVHFFSFHTFTAKLSSATNTLTPLTFIHLCTNKGCKSRKLKILNLIDFATFCFPYIITLNSPNEWMNEWKWKVGWIKQNFFHNVGWGIEIRIKYLI
jgi:hypothetical protein